MKRVSKAPEERRDELLDTALLLCTTVGYDVLSIEQLTREAGVAKGTFYYYFGSKQDMLVALVERFADEIFAELEDVEAGLTGTAVQRLSQLMTRATAWKTARLDSTLAPIALLYKPENLELRHRLNESWTLRTRGLFLPLITLGAGDGSFALDDPDATTDLVLALWVDGGTRLYDRALGADTEDAFVDILTRGITALTTGVGRLLGTAPGAFDFDYDPGGLRSMRAPFLAALHTEPSPRSTRSSR